jgi:hypothetical protein
MRLPETALRVVRIRSITKMPVSIAMPGALGAFDPRRAADAERLQLAVKG